MIVDVQNHVMPPLYAEAMAGAGIVDFTSQPPAVRWRGISIPIVEDFVDLEKHTQVCRQAGVTHVMLHQGMMLTVANEVLGWPTADTAKRHNDAMAELRERHDDLIFPYGYVRPHDGGEAVREAERCLEELGFKGLAVDTSYGTVDRVYPHAVETYGFWEFVEDRGVPVYIHPALFAYGWEWMDRFKLDETVARPNETALTASLMILTGLFDRFPGVRIVLAHMGGGFTMVLPRLQFGHRLGYEAMFPYQKARNEREPVEYAKENIFVDCMGFHPPGIRHAIEVYGIDHILFGSDYGPLPISPREHVNIIRDELGLSEEDQDKILWSNAKVLFGL